MLHQDLFHRFAPLSGFPAAISCNVHPVRISFGLLILLYHQSSHKRRQPCRSFTNQFCRFLSSFSDFWFLNLAFEGSVIRRTSWFTSKPESITATTIPSLITFAQVWGTVILRHFRCLRFFSPSWRFVSELVAATVVKLLLRFFRYFRFCFWNSSLFGASVFFNKSCFCCILLLAAPLLLLQHLLSH